ncbi:hypothetical protein [Priestia aryabhattai]|uniref:hypothetical protein n=1 Tax=Priestia aryabhattai TaxID=412384 RepID=UPI0037368DFB
MEHYPANKTSLAMADDTLTLTSGQADYIELKSPNGKPIQDIFFFDPQENNKMTALTGKQYISDVRWKLWFHNTDPNQSITLKFFILTRPF